MMKIAIVEDNRDNQVALKNHIMHYAKEHNLPVVIDCYNDGIEIIDKFKSDYDLIYLDVEMEILDGMTTAGKIREYDEEVLIVFVTNYVQWAIEGYAVNATDFLLKPLSYFNFSEHFKKIEKQLINRQDRSYTLKTGSGFRKIDLNHLLYIESDGHYLEFILTDESFSILESMKNVEEELLPYDFFRCNNGYIVNLKHVTNVEKNIVTVGPYQLQISRPRRKDFMIALTNYIGADLK